MFTTEETRDDLRKAWRFDRDLDRARGRLRWRLFFMKPIWMLLSAIEPR